MPVAFVMSTAGSFSSGGASTVTVSLNAGTVADRLVAAFGQSASTAFTGVTYAGASMTLAGSNSETRLFYKNQAASGANNVVMTVGTYMSGVYALAAFSGVSSTTPVGSVGSGSGTSSTPATSSMTLPSDGMIYGALWTSYATSLSVSAGSGTTLRSSARNSAIGYQVAGGTRASTGTVAWTLGASMSWRALGFPINAAAVAAGSEASARAFPRSILNL